MLKVHGRENIPRKGRVIIASNHISHLDPPLIGVSAPRNVAFIAKIELFRTPILGWWMRAMGQIGVERGGGGRKALVTAQDVLEKENAIIIFPEGTRSATGRVARGKTGVAVLALKTGSPVVPAAITGSYKAFKRGMKFPKPGRVVIHFGKPIEINGGLPMTDEIPREMLEEVTAKIMREIQKLLPEDMRARPGEVPDGQLFSDALESPANGAKGEPGEQ